MSQMNICGKPVKAPEEIEEKAKPMLEPEEETVVINPVMSGKDSSGVVVSEQSGLGEHVHIPTICPMCRQDKELVWVNPGNLGPNTEICGDCIPRLFEGYGYKEPGFRIIDGNTVEIFSQTTGWERIKTYWVKEVFGSAFANALFPVSAYLEHEEIKETSDSKLDHNCFGITWACAKFLSLRANVPMPDQKPAGNVIAQS